ncbi:hypothetical protein RB614_14425 [Phytohabitans sp. ZYX-F-186]|uniref:Uncharacterized protein n=1 Tax=Phytohabitans maris TaxID=3071409 RepID=A0ABU0ZF78_9ACTN|nr:hypothetical protein [Phytohabitans sp. ZYX-F-186]MDQ7905711.1 hypothetical protein [Phytohabitans sp. ZYX-F-186]
MTKGLRRMGVAIALVSAMLPGALFFTGSAAQASGCYVELEVNFDNGVLSASHYQICDQTNSRKKLKVMIEKYQPAIGTIPARWVIVAEGKGDVVYRCQGTVTNLFWIDRHRQSYYACD